MNRLDELFCAIDRFWRQTMAGTEEQQRRTLRFAEPRALLAEARQRASDRTRRRRDQPRRLPGLGFDRRFRVRQTRDRPDSFEGARS